MEWLRHQASAFGSSVLFDHMVLDQKPVTLGILPFAPGLPQINSPRVGGHKHNVSCRFPLEIVDPFGMECID